MGHVVVPMDILVKLELVVLNLVFAVPENPSVWHLWVVNKPLPLENV
jgi:hypothetical protein